MRIAVASDDGVNVAMHTGRCRGFVIYEAVEQAVTRGEYRTNSFTAHAQGECEGHTHAPGQSHHSHAPLLGGLADCEVLVTRGLGQRLIVDLASRGITTYLCGVDLADEAAAQYARGLLPRADLGGGCCCHH